MSLRSDLGKVQGRGAAHSGVHHWWVQRLSAIALVPLSVWFVASLLPLVRLGDAGYTSYAAVHAWVGQSGSALLLILLVLVATWHSLLGVRVVIEDYVHDSGQKTLSLVLSSFVHALLAAAGVFAILKISFGVVHS
jgi:succinate dehydrogenase / fumarate reductase membrane anchor subunit